MSLYLPTYSYIIFFLDVFAGMITTEHHKFKFEVIRWNMGSSLEGMLLGFVIDTVNSFTYKKYLIV